MQSTLLGDPLAVIGVFMIGAATGAILAYAKLRDRIGRYLETSGVAQGDAVISSHSPHCQLKALIVGRDPEFISIFSQLLREMGIDSQKHLHVLSAVTQLSSDKFQLVVLDFDHRTTCVYALSNLSRLKQQTLLLCVASDPAAKRAAFDLGAAAVIERPLIPSQVRTTLSSAYGRMLRDSQQYFRLAISLHVTIERASGAVLDAITLNLSQNGMAITSAVSFGFGEQMRLTFEIASAKIFVKGKGQVIWDDQHGKTGISFKCADPTVERQLVEWLHGQYFLAFHTSAPQPSAEEVHIL